MSDERLVIENRNGIGEVRVARQASKFLIEKFEHAMCDSGGSSHCVRCNVFALAKIIQGAKKTECGALDGAMGELINRLRARAMFECDKHFGSDRLPDLLREAAEALYDQQVEIAEMRASLDDLNAGYEHVRAERDRLQERCRELETAILYAVARLFASSPDSPEDVAYSLRAALGGED